METNRIFGISLNDIMARPSQKLIPTSVREMIIQLQKTGLNTNYLFRETVSNEEIEKAKEIVDTDCSVEYKISSMNPYVIANLLKLYFRQLPDSLLTYNLHSMFIEHSNDVMGLREIVQNRLSIHHKRLAEILFLFLGSFIDHFSSNKMPPSEISMIFSSLVLRPKSETLESMIDLPKRNQVIMSMIYNADVIFPESKPRRSIIQKVDENPLGEERLKIQAIQETLKTHLNDISIKIDELKNEIKNMHRIVDIATMAATLKSMKELFQNHANSKKSNLNSNSKAIFSCKSSLQSGHCSLQGPRPTMEDRVQLFDDFNLEYPTLSRQINRSFYAVFDGHAGSEVSQMASEIVSQYIVSDLGENNLIQAMQSGLIKADEKIVTDANEHGWVSGSTAVICLIVQEKLYICNLGDSEAVVCEHVGNTYRALELSRKHKPGDDSEKERILALGAAVFRGRIFGKLAVSRALGDPEFKIPKAKANYVSNEVYVNSIDLNENHEFIILACDGLWDKVSHQQAVDFVQEQLSTGKTAQETSEILAQHALDIGSKDNVSVVIVVLKWKPVEL